MHYLLFIPYAQQKTAMVALTDVGLADFVQGAEYLPLASGPEEKPGLLCAWRKPGKNERMHFKASEQTWIRSAKFGESEPGRYHIGFWNDSPVTPEDLQRPYSHAGKVIELGDGNSWRFPTIDELPKDLILADDGTWKFKLQQDYHDLWLEAEDWATRLLQGGTHNFGEITEFCIRCLRQNYRLLPEAVSHLRLFNTNNIQKAMGSLLGMEVASE